MRLIGYKSRRGLSTISDRPARVRDDRGRSLDRTLDSPRRSMARIFDAIRYLRAARMNAATLAASFRPGEDSTPLATSTIQGRTRATFAGDVLGSQTAGQDQPGQGGNAIEDIIGDGRAGAARLAGHVGIDQDRVRKATQGLGLREVVDHSRPSPRRWPSRNARIDLELIEHEKIFRRFLAVQSGRSSRPSARRYRPLRRPADRRTRPRRPPIGGRTPMIAAARAGST